MNYKYVNVPEPILENPEGEWWWVWTGDHWEPCFVETLNGEPMVFLWGEKIEEIGGFLLDDLDARCRFTGPIPEPPKPEEVKK